MTYKDYLRGRKYSESSIHRSSQHLLRFQNWLRANDLKPELLDYGKLLSYLHVERSRGIQEVSLRHYLRYVRWYYDYLLSIKKIKEHPLLHLNLNRQYQKAKTLDLHSLLSKEDLELIYISYCRNGRLSEQSKIVLGLLVYQGISVGELGSIVIGDLDLVNGELLMRSSKRHEGRKLKIESKQILMLANYIRGKALDGRLLAYKNGSHASNSRYHLSNQIKLELRKQGHLKVGFINLQQLRRSVISIWVKAYNLREAQYLAGHKWVHSTEAYLQEDIEELQDQVEIYHPLQ